MVVREGLGLALVDPHGVTHGLSMDRNGAQLTPPRGIDQLAAGAELPTGCVDLGTAGAANRGIDAHPRETVTELIDTVNGCAACEVAGSRVQRDQIDVRSQAPSEDR